MKKVFIQGQAGSGKTYFFLPEIIKILKSYTKKIYRIQPEKLRDEKYFGPHWNKIEFNEYDSIAIEKDDMIFCDEAHFIEDENIQYEISEHPFVVLTSWEPIEEIHWLNPAHFVIIRSEYIKPQGLLYRIFKNESKAKIRELKKLI